jgi:hypothetical protein
MNSDKALLSFAILILAGPIALAILVTSVVWGCMALWEWMETLGKKQD